MRLQTGSSGGKDQINPFLLFLKGIELGMIKIHAHLTDAFAGSPAFCDSMDSTSEGWESRSRRQHRSCHPGTDRNEQTSLWVNRLHKVRHSYVSVTEKKFPPPGFIPTSHRPVLLHVPHESSHRRVLLYLSIARFYSNFPPPGFTPSSTRIFPPPGLTLSSTRIFPHPPLLQVPHESSHRPVLL